MKTKEEQEEFERDLFSLELSLCQIRTFHAKYFNKIKKQKWKQNIKGQSITKTKKRKN